LNTIIIFFANCTCLGIRMTNGWWPIE